MCCDIHHVALHPHITWLPRARMDVMAHEEEPWFDMEDEDEGDVLLPANGNGAAELATNQ